MLKLHSCTYTNINYEQMGLHYERWIPHFVSEYVVANH